MSDWLSYSGAIVPARKNRCSSRSVGRNGRFRIDPPPSPIAQIEDDCVRRFIRGELDPSSFIGTEIGSIMEMPKGNHPERGLTCKCE